MREGERRSETQYVERERGGGGICLGEGKRSRERKKVEIEEGEREKKKKMGKGDVVGLWPLPGPNGQFFFYHLDPGPKSHFFY
jgi:hypothetical protein